MRAVVLDRYGDVDVLGVREVPDPVPGPDEVLVDVVATALNRAELLQRRGMYPTPPPKPPLEIPGLEFSGIVAAMGERVIAWKPGDVAMGIVTGGGYASRVAIHERQAMRVPRGVAVVDAAALPEVFLTAWDALFLQGGLTSGRSALVHAGASGVGTAAIQLVKAAGGSVVVTASAGKLEACRKLGADVAVDYASDDFVAAARELTGGRGVDVVLDVIGGEYLERNIDALALHGHIVQVGVMASPTATFTLAKLMPKRASLTGTVLRARPIEEKIALAQRFTREVLPWFESSPPLMQPVIDRRFTLEQIADAHQYLESNANVGKVVIDIASM